MASRRSGISTRYKYLKGVAHDLAHSFTSYADYVNDDYVMSYLLRRARECDSPPLRFVARAEDWSLTDEYRTAPLLLAFVRFADWLPLDVDSVEMELLFDLERERPLVLDLQGVIWVTKEAPFECTVSIRDDRGKAWTKTVAGWWWSDPK